MTVAMTKARPLVPIASLSLLVTVVAIHFLLLISLSVASTTAPTITIALIPYVMPVHHANANNAVSAKIFTQLNGLRAKCTTPPLTPKMTKLLRHYIKPLNHQRLVRLLPYQVADPICHHVAIIILTPLTMLTTVNDPHDAAATLPAALAVALTAVISMTMIVNHCFSSAHHSSPYVDQNDVPPLAKRRAIDVTDCKPINTIDVASEVSLSILLPIITQYYLNHLVI